jgi:phosphoketolase
VIKYAQRLKDHRVYVIEHGTDPDDITNWIWTSRSL